MTRSRSSRFLVVVAVLMALPSGLAAQGPLRQDERGDLWFHTPNRTVLRVGMNGDLAINGELLMNCRQTPSGEVARQVGAVECRGGYYSVEDRFGNELLVYPTIAQAETSDGSEYQLPLSRSPVRVRVDLSGGDVRVETAAETVTVGADGAVSVDGPGGEEVVVQGDDLRIRAGGLEVTGDWRSGGRYGAAETERVLVELGARDEDGLIRVALAGDVLFDFDSSAIRPDAAAELGKAAHVIRQRSVGDVYVVGHTDSVGRDDYNQELSEQRAVAVMSFLNRREGIPVSVMVGRGLGASQPVAHNTRPDGSDDPVGRARNRRVEILLATRADVAVVDIAGLVRVGEGGIDVGGGAVKVDEKGVEVAGGAVRVGEDGVRVGGVEVVPGGVRIEAGDPSAARVVDDGAAVTCRAGQVCSWTCPGGDCQMTCEPGAACDFGCGGGDCTMRCKPGATCNLGCGGGDCLFACAVGSVCNTSCGGGDCRGP